MRGKYMRKLICCMLVAMMGVTQPSFHRRQIFPAWLPSPGFPLF